MTKEIYENSVLDDSAEAIEEQETELCEDAARNVIGVVTDCLKLNIREKPSKDSRVVTVVTCLDELEIDIGDSNDDWYAVCTATGIEGFCMKKFVAVRQQGENDMDSILTSIKKLLGIAEEYEHFDPDIVMYINSAFSVLTQLGVGPEEGFRIEDASKTWSEFLYDDPRLEFVKTFIYLKVRLAFDPPLSSAVMEAINRQISELEWRINVTVDPD